METNDFSKAVKKSSLNLGISLGLLLIVINTLIYAFSPSLFANWMLNLVLFFLIVGVGIYSIIKAKSIQNGFITFKEAFVAFFITIVVTTFITTIFSFVLFNIIDDGSVAELIKEETIKTTAATLEKFNTPVEQYNQTIEGLENTDAKANFSLSRMFLSFALGLVFYSIIGAIFALIFKKENPNQY